MNTLVDNDQYFSLADNIFFVLFVYLLVIGVWSAACNHDFISAKWKSVKKTRVRGLTHFFVITIPMAYILAYIIIQSKSGDFKEVGAAAVALCFAWLHLSRTFWGLWQLYEFKRWATEAIKSIESLGFNFGQKSAQHLADEILVNDTIIDNRLMEGLVRCNLRFINPQQVENISSRNSSFTQMWMYTKLIVCGIAGIFKVIAWVLIDRIETKSFFENTPYIEPLEPEELWLRWASVLVADAIPEWLDSVLLEDQECTDKNEFNSVRDEFAREILLSAALHVQKCDASNSHAFLSYDTIRKFNKLNTGKFSKYEFLRNSIITGNGLPFNAPHELAFDEESGRYCYQKFKPKLKRIVDSLPADRHEKVMNLGISQIEWLAVFLSLKSWGNFDSKAEITECPNARDDSVVDESHFPVINLAVQLGFVEKDGSKNVANNFKIPLHKYSKRSILWGNRNLLECSLHIDNWISITAGTYIQDMLRHSKDKPNTSSWTFEYNKKLEYDRNRFQQLFMAPYENHFEQTLTFLGCSMEVLRTLLAQWTVRNEILQRSEWNPKLKDACNFTKKFSTDFGECLNSLHNESDIESMYFKMRLLWELQNIFRRSLISSEEGPASESAMIFCILSFPAISIESNPSSIYRDDSVTIQIENNSKYEKCLFQIHDYTFKIKAEGLPENCEILVTIIDSQLEVLFNRSKNYVRFSWEEWRNSFQGRLSGLRQWQWENWSWSSITSLQDSNDGLSRTVSKIETADNLLRSKFPITSGISRMKLISAGTGDCLTVWKGWLPHRRNMCQFELESSGLIRTRKHLGYEPIKVRINGDRLIIQCPHVQYQTMPYSKCDREALQRCTVISAAAILDMSNGKKHNESSSSGLGESLRKMANRLTKADNYNFTVSITMFETAAVYYGDFEALESAVTLLKEKNQYEQASTLIELYFYSQFSPKKQFKPKSDIPGNVVQTMISKLRVLFEDCVSDSDYSSSIAERYAQFCLCLSSSGHLNCIEEAKLILQRVFLRAVGSAFSGDLLQCIKLYCSLLVSTETVDDVDLEGMIMSKMREFARNISDRRRESIIERNLIRPLKYLGNRIAVAEDKDDLTDEIGRDIEFSLARLFEGKARSNIHDIQLASVLYRSATEKNHTSAAYNYAIMLQKGTHGVEKNPAKAKDLYIQAANAGMFRAAFNVARMLQKGDTGVEPNPIEAIKFYRQAIDAGYMKAAFNLGNLYKKGAEGVIKNIKEAIALFTQASDAGSIKSTFALADIYLDNSDEESFNPQRAIYFIRKAANSVEDNYNIGSSETIEEEMDRADELLQRDPRSLDAAQILTNIKSMLSNIHKEANGSETVK